MAFDPKKWLYNIHRHISPSPTALKWMVPLISAPAAYFGHKYITEAGAKGLNALGMHSAGERLKKTNPWLFAGAVTALNTALSQGIYQPRYGTDSGEMGDWRKFFYGNEKTGMEKRAEIFPQIQAAAIQQGWNDDPLMTQQIKVHNWMVPSVNSRNLKENIYDTPGFTPGQKTFLRDSVEGAIQVANNPELLSMNDLGIGSQHAIVNSSKEVPGMWEIASQAVPRAIEGAFIGRAIGTMFGASDPTVKILQNTGLAAGVLNTNPVMKKIKSYF